jgi:2-hydroxychromene-2-carboxylate isomerase
MIRATLFNDPACPWGYSANPQFRVLEWRYREQLEWRLVLIGLREAVPEEARRGFDPGKAAGRWSVFRNRYGMPFALAPKARPTASARACRAVVAARLLDPGSEWRVIKALQLANFTTPLLLDDDEQLREALRAWPGIDADAIVDRLDDDEVSGSYERDRAEARTAAGTAIETQGKAAVSDGLVRYTAPSIVFERDGQQLVAGGWQPALAYDLVVANLEPEIEPVPPPASPAPLLDHFTDGLTTAEVAALLADGPDPVPDLGLAEAALLELVGQGTAQRVPFGHDALWVRGDARSPALPDRAATAVA